MQRGDKEFMADGPTRMPKRNLLERYDANRDGKITLAELGNAESVLERLDKNGDGVLSGSETK
jgi:Ca2+-binding EF-hand superfamily protein